MHSSTVKSSEQSALSEVSLPPLLRSFERCTILLFVFSVAYHLFCYFILHRGGHQAYPLSLDSHDRFYDFTIFTEKFKYFHTARFWSTGYPINYPAPACVIFELFFRYLAPHELLAFIVFCVFSFVVPTALFANALISRGIVVSSATHFVVVACLLSWPVLLIVDGGNAEVEVWLTMLIATWAYSTDRAWIAAIFFGLAASLKLFPFVFLALFLRRGQLGKLLAGVATFFATSLISLAIVGPTVAEAYRGVASGLASFKTNYMAVWRTGENGVDHSLFALYKCVRVVIGRGSNHDFHKSLHVYMLITLVGGLLMYLLRIRKLPLLNQLLTLTVASIYLTAFSGDGTLVHLYYPLGMLFLLAIRAHRDRVTIPGLSFILGCMAFCLSFESFLVGAHNSEGFRLIGPAHAIGLGFLLIAALRYPLGPPLSEERGEIVLSQPETDWA